jgi:cell fate (sporulation/competence/biofilm development) regulator YlbF (YheA/YmcA/DUF963 family)
MDVIQMARELGKQIQTDERYTAYQNAKTANDNDEKLQELISRFNIKRVELNTEISKDDKSTEKIKELDEEIKNLYGDIMINPNMIAFNEAKNAMDDMLSQINTVITSSANGEDPETCAVSACTGSCAACGGCH